MFALRAHCVRTACIVRTQRLGYSPKNTTHLSSSTAKQQTPNQNTKTACSLVIRCPQNKEISLIKYNLAKACKMHTCSSGKCHTRIYHRDGGHTIGNILWLAVSLPNTVNASYKRGKRTEREIGVRGGVVLQKIKMGPTELIEEQDPLKGSTFSDAHGWGRG